MGVLGKATKSIRWMPWHLEAMKDVGNCDKLRGAVTQAIIRRFPNGKTRLIEDEALCAEYIGVTERTQGTETSQYLKEKKSIEIPSVAASEGGRAQTTGCARWGCRASNKG